MKTDMELQREVINELKREPSVNSAEIGVAVKDGAVTLSGYVDSFGEKRAAERSAAKMKNVKAIADGIQVRLPASGRHDDADIAREAANLLAWNTFVPRDAVKVIVEDAWVTLTGDVGMWYQKWNAETALHNIAGIRGITNEIEIKPETEAKEVRVELVDALGRNALLDSRTIDVEAEGSRIVLRGTVRSWLEREEAEFAAHSSPGVSVVDNHILVE
jgi:osmotically-inducible protein OsmY